MENHVHLLLRDSQTKISVFMKKTGVSYAQYYNRKYEHTGHLFQDRYKSELIADDTYLLSVFRYILNNPVKAGICPAEEYPWSSYREYGKANGLTDPGMLYDTIGSGAEFQQFMQREVIDMDSFKISSSVIDRVSAIDFRWIKIADIRTNYTHHIAKLNIL